MVCRVVYLGWEQKPTGAARAIVGLRDNSNGISTCYFYLNEPIKIATNFILTDNHEKTSWAVKSCLRDEKLFQYPFKDRFHDREKYQTFEIDMPFDKRLTKKLPKELFQKGNYTQTLRYKRKWMYNEIELDDRLKRAIELKNELDSRLYVSAGSKDVEIKSDELEAMIISADSSLKQLDQKNSFSYNPKTKDYEISLNSEFAFNVKDNPISLEELKRERWVYYDIEKPLWKTDHQKRMIKRRNYRVDLLNGGKLKAERRLPILRGLFEREEDLKEKAEYERKIGILRKGIEKYYLIEEEKRKASNFSVIKVLEPKLTEEIESYQVKWFDEKYSAKISWFPILFKLENGEEIRELHTLYDFNYYQIDGFRVISHKSEKDLLDAVGKRMRELKPFIYPNPNLAYDVSQTRFAAEEENADMMDLLVRGINPGRDVSIHAYQRVKENTGQIRLDLWRFGANFRPFLRGSNPKGNHKLESMADFDLGKGKFKKSIDYAEMRNLEVLAINRDKDAMVKLARYAVSDVEVVKEIMENTKYLEWVYDAWKLMPQTTLTKAAFSTSSSKDILDYLHWKEHGNHRNAGKLGNKRQKEREIVIEKRLPEIKRKQLKDFSINVPFVRGFYSEVKQVYIPLELWLRDCIEKSLPRGEDYYANLSNKPLERFAQLQYIRQFFAKDMAVDYYFERNAFFRFEKFMTASRKPRTSLELMLRRFSLMAGEGELRKLDSEIEMLRDSHRGIYFVIPEELRREIRLPRLRVANEQKEMDIDDWLIMDNYDFIKMIKQKEIISKCLSEKKRRILAGFMTRFANMLNHVSRLEVIAKQISKEFADEAEDFVEGNVFPEEEATVFEVQRAREKFDLNIPRNLVYIAFLRRRMQRRSARFYTQYHFGADILRTKIRDGYSRLADELKRRKTRIVEVRGDYLFLNGGDLDFGANSMIIPIRTIMNFPVDPGNPKLMKKRKIVLDLQREMFGVEEVRNEELVSIFE